MDPLVDTSPLERAAQLGSITTSPLTLDDESEFSLQNVWISNIPQTMKNVPQITGIINNHCHRSLENH
jgi:hypothetical protein